MTISNTSFLDACRGRRPARTPVWLMRQAGRYMPEYRAIRSRVSFLELCRDPALCAEVTLQPIDALGVDAAILFSDILVVLDVLELALAFEPAPVLAAPVRDADALCALPFARDLDPVSYVFEAVTACKRALADRVPLIGFSGAPLTVLSYIVEGGGSREFEHTKRLAFAHPARFRAALEGLSELLGRYLVGQIRAGADAVQIFDSWAAMFSPADYRALVLPSLRALVEGLGGHGVPVILFARGNAELLADVASLPADVIGVDWSIDLSDAIGRVGRDRVVQGNLDPMRLLGTPESLVSETQAMLSAGSLARGHVANLGHGIHKTTDPAMAKLFVDTVHAFSPPRRPAGDES